jgi:CheY-like chemotaxis protein
MAAAPMSAAESPPMRCIVVDDEPTARLHLRLLLEQWGRVDEAENAAVALEQIREAVKADDPYGLVCIDLTMPGPDGIEAIAMIRDVDLYMRKGQHTGIVIVSASQETKDVLGALRNHADDYLVKPVTPAKLAETVGRITAVHGGGGA